VAFDVGGIPEMVDHLHNGYVARYRDTSDLANGIYWAMQTENYGTLSEMAVRKVTERYSEEAISRQYIKIYNQITGKENA
jgi:glycosyltransferase involved in cell wall biosynthesis